MIKKADSLNFTIYLVLTALLANFAAYPMENDTISLDDLKLGDPYDWEPYLTKYSITEILKVITLHKNYGAMTDSKGNNLPLAFSKKYDCYLNRYKYFDFNKEASFIKKTISQLFSLKFDINFQNTKTGDTLLLDWISMKNQYKDYSIMANSTLVEWLIQTYNPNLNLQNNESNTALSLTEDYTLMELLLKHGAHPVIIDKSGVTICCSAPTKKSAQLLRMFGYGGIDYKYSHYNHKQEIEIFFDYYKQYNDIIKSKEFNEESLEELIHESKESVQYSIKQQLVTTPKQLIILLKSHSIKSTYF